MMTYKRAKVPKQDTRGLPKPGLVCVTGREATLCTRKSEKLLVSF